MTNEDDAQRFGQYGDWYDRNLPDYEKLSSITVEKLKEATKAAGIKTHSITSRVKERTSFLEKIQRKTYADPFRDTGDLVGARVVSLFNQDLGAVDRAIRSCFIVVDRDDKEKKTDPKKFGYTSGWVGSCIRSRHSPGIAILTRRCDISTFLGGILPISSVAAWTISTPNASRCSRWQEHHGDRDIEVRLRY